MVPIFTSGDSSKITNYRPISVLSFFSKVFERVMYNHITDFIDSLNVLYKYQFRHGKDMLSIITTLNHELHTLSTWLKANKLSLNTDKTYYMIFHRARIKLPDTDYPIIMNNSPLSNIQNHKYLGVILDSKMSWIQHISYVKNKVAKGIGSMFKARTYLDRRSLINIYNAYIYPYLIYCVESWGNAAKCHLDPLYILHTKIVGLITFSNYNQATHVPS